MEIRYVEWVDSAGGSRWTGADQIKKEPVRLIRTVGFVLTEDDSRVVMVQSEDPPLLEDEKASVDNWMVIPKIAITLQETLRVGE